MFTGLAIAFVVVPLASALNDILSSVWGLAIACSRGKLLDFCKVCTGKIGFIIAGAAFVGGVISPAAYVSAIHLAGSAVIPISALCPAIGALLSRILYKAAFESENPIWDFTLYFSKLLDRLYVAEQRVSPTIFSRRFCTSSGCCILLRH